MNVRRFSFTHVLMLVACAGVGVFVFSASAHAQTAVANLSQVADITGLGTQDIRLVIGNIVRIALGFLGIIAVGLVLYGGFLWMTARGDADKVTKARQVLINAGIGLVIILSSLAITQFVMNALKSALGIGTQGGGGAGAEIIDPSSSALGAGIIDWHYPARGAQGVARNSNISVSFRQPMDPASLVEEYAGDPSSVGTLREGSVRVYVSSAGASASIGAADIQVSMTPDLKTFVFNPVPLLGSAAEDMAYTVELTPNIQKANGDSAFSGAFSAGYKWTFTVGTFLDTTPPKVTSVIPLNNSTNPRNILVQVNYSEAVDPTTASGFYPAVPPVPPFANITATDGEQQIVEGQWNIVNQSRTSEFITTDACGTNSCGETIYCLPANDRITVRVVAASVGSEPPAALMPANGVVDMAGNALDGNGDGQATGPASDSYVFTFSTTNEIRLAPPLITSVTPSILPGTPAQNVAFDQPIRVLFDTFLSLSTMNADNIQLRSPSDKLWYTFSADVAVGPPETHEVTVNHGIFSDEILYGTMLDSGLRSVYQNCFTPSRSAGCSGSEPNCCDDQSQSAQCVYPYFGL